jgi:DNA ligase (NAD+)
MITTHDEFLATVAKAEEAAKAYYDTETLTMSDAEYDTLVQDIELAADHFGWQEGNRVLEAVAAGSSSGGNVTHDVPMLSLGKVRSLEEVEAFVARNAGYKTVFEPKLDGLAISARYVNGKLTTVATRGDGHTGEDITESASRSHVKGLPQFLSSLDTFEVRGEVFIGAKDFETAQIGRHKARGDYFANPRNAVSGSLRTSKDTSYVHMTFGVYDVIGLSDSSYTNRMAYLDKLGFISAMSLVPEEIRKLQTVTDEVEGFAIARHHLDAPTDGAVVKFDSYKLREALGAAQRHPRWAVAYKYEAEITQTVLRDIVREVGRTGAISYVAQVDAVELEGSTVTKATLNNSAFIANLDLRIGDTIFIRKANGIIPEIDSVNLALRPVGATPYVAPTTCPKCGKPLDTESSVVWRCTNPEDAIGALLAYDVSRDILDVDGMSTAVIDKLLESGVVTDLADLFMLTQQQLAELVMGYTENGKVKLLGEKVAQKLYANLQNAKNQPLSRVLSALGIRMMGRTFGRRLATHFGSMSKIQQATMEDFLAVDGVAIGRAEEFVLGFERNRALIAKLKNAGFKSLLTENQPEIRTQKPAVNQSQTLAGMSVVVTGSVEGYSRTQLTELIESLGGKSSSSVTSKTSLVVLGENAGSKADKAKSLGLRTLDAASFLAFVKAG